MQSSEDRLSQPDPPMPGGPSWGRVGCGIGIAVTLVGVAVTTDMLLRSRRAWSDGERRGSSQAFVQDLSVALKAYDTDYGRYPPGPNAAMVRALTPKGPKGIAFYSFRPDQISASGEFLDPWSRPYIYESGNPRPGFRLYSVGPNGKDEGGAGDDIMISR